MKLEDIFTYNFIAGPVGLLRLRRKGKAGRSSLVRVDLAHVAFTEAWNVVVSRTSDIDVHRDDLLRRKGAFWFVEGAPHRAREISSSRIPLERGERRLSLRRARDKI